MHPLDGLKVLSFEQYGAGPYATLHLADLGAEIIKVEDPTTGGDVGRSVVPYAEDGDSLFFQTFNRNKKSITLDIRSDEGKAMLTKLVQNVDVVFNNFRGDVPKKLGLTYEALKEHNPKIVCCSLSGFGANNSKAKHPAYDYLFQAMAGHMSLTGDPTAPPTKFGLSVIDYSSGIMAALAIMVGVYHAGRTGVGCELDVSLFDTSYSLLNYVAAWHLNGGYRPERTPLSAHPSLVPSQLLETKDGYIMIMCNKEKFFKELCRCIGADALLEDERFVSFDSRLKNREFVIQTLQSFLSQKTTDEWLGILTGVVPCAAVNSVETALKDPFVSEKELIVEYHHPKFGTVKTVGPAISSSLNPVEHRRAPFMGEHNDEVYQSIGGVSLKQ